MACATTLRAARPRSPRSAGPGRPAAGSWPVSLASRPANRRIAQRPIECRDRVGEDRRPVSRDDPPDGPVGDEPGGSGREAPALRPARRPRAPRISVGRSVSASPARSVPSVPRKPRWSGRWPGSASALSRPSPAPTSGAVRDLGHRPRQRAGATGADQDRDVPARPQLLRPRRVTRVDVGQRDRDDPTAGAARPPPRSNRGTPLPDRPDRRPSTSRRPTRTVFAGRPARPMAFWPRRTRSAGSSRSTEIAGSGARTSPSRIAPNADRPFEPLERGRRRRPHRDLARRASGRGQLRGVSQAWSGHLAGIDVEDRARGQLGDEEPGVEPTGEGPRGRPARDLDEVVGPELEPSRPRSTTSPRARPARGAEPVRRRREQDPDLLPGLADRGDPMGDVEGGIRPRHRGPDRTSPGSASAGSTRPPGKTWSPAAKAIESGRRVSRTSSPAGASRTRTIVAAGTGLDRRAGVVATGRRSTRRLRARRRRGSELEREAEQVDARLRLAVPLGRPTEAHPLVQAVRGGHQRTGQQDEPRAAGRRAPGRCTPGRGPARPRGPAPPGRPPASGTRPRRRASDSEYGVPGPGT